MKYKKFLVGFDVHGDQQDFEANKAFFEFNKRWKPEIRVAGGDIWDFRAIRKKASEEEKRDSMQLDYELGTDWLERFKPTHFLRGNHDERLFDLAKEEKGLISDYAKSGIAEIHLLMKKLHCQMLPYDKIKGVLRLGHLKIVHGYCTGVNASRRSAQAYGSVLMGHGHGIQHVSIEGIENRMGRMCGCLCKLDMEYLRANLGSLTHRHGWAYGVIADNGDFFVWQAERIGNKWLLPTGLEEL